MRLKHWHYVCLNHSQVFLSVAIADLGYVGNAFVYLVDRATGQRYEMETIIPLGLGIRKSENSSTWRGITVGTLGCQLDLDLGGFPLRAEVRLAPTETLALLYPLSENRGAYTHKQLANQTSGWLEWQDKRFDLGGAFGGMDHTCSYADRRTRWKWAFLSGTTQDGRRLGLNASQHLYGAAENYVWLDGARHPLGEVRFSSPPEGAWTLTGPAVDIRFEPQGRRVQNVNYGLVSSKFQQPYGSAHGAVTIEGREIPLGEIYGVCEDHLALW